jgi:hypothetical protein
MRGYRQHQLGRSGPLDRGGAKHALGVALLTVGAMGFVSAADATATDSWANAAHVLNVKDGGHLHEVRSSGAELLEEGPVSGTIPGKVKVSFDIGATITAKFTIYANGGGSISGSGGGALHSTSVYSSFGGSLKVTGGSGRYAHAHGTGTLSGQIDRKTYALTVQADGKLYY